MFSLACNITFTGYLKVLVLNVPWIGNTFFFEFEDWWKDDIYWLLKSSWFGLWKALFLNFPEMGNTVFFLSHKVERWYLLGLFELSNMFQDLGNKAFVQCTQSKWVPSVKNGKSGHHYWFSTLVFVSNFSLYWQFWTFLTKFTISNFFARRKTVATVF